MFEELKPTIKILLRFIVMYLSLLGLYQLYLDSQVGLDGFSRLIAEQCTALQNVFGYPSELYSNPKYPNTVWFLVNGISHLRMIERCNAVSIMILYVAFVFAFYRGYKTFIFALVTLLFLHIINVFRILMLNIIYSISNEYGEIAHDYMFPAIIYGSIVLFWLIWLKFFVIKKKNEA